MAEEWGPREDHDGCGCPVPRGTVVRGFYRDGSSEVWTAMTKPILIDDGWGWDWNSPEFYTDGTDPLPKDIVAFQVCRPDALRNLIDLAEQVEDLTPETVKALVGV